MHNRLIPMILVSFKKNFLIAFKLSNIYLKIIQIWIYIKKKFIVHKFF